MSQRIVTIETSGDPAPVNFLLQMNTYLRRVTIEWSTDIHRDHAVPAKGSHAPHGSRKANPAAY